MGCDIIESFMNITLWKLYFCLVGNEEALGLGLGEVGVDKMDSAMFKKNKAASNKRTV